MSYPKIRLEWFRNGAAFSPTLWLEDYQEYLDNVSQALASDKPDPMAVRRIQAQLLEKVLKPELPENERATFRLTMPQIADAMQQVQQACFPAPPVCAQCGGELPASGAPERGPGGELPLGQPTSSPGSSPSPA